MKKIRAFTLIELLVVIAIIALLIGILVPALGSARKQANRMKNGTQVRAILTALFLYADNSEGAFPDGDVIHRFQILCDTSGAGQSLDPKLLISPGETDSGTYKVAATNSLLNETTTPYSYALLSKLNTAEWRHNSNASAVLVSDRQLSSGKGSIWDAENWKGTMGWGDGHVSFENDDEVSTQVKGVYTEKDKIFEGTAASDIVMVSEKTAE